MSRRFGGVRTNSISGLEDIWVVERKDLSDLVRSFTVERPVFVARLRQMSEYPHRLLVVTAASSQVKSPYPHSAVNPNQITQSLIAVLAGLRVPFVCTEDAWCLNRAPPRGDPPLHAQIPGRSSGS